MDAIKGRFKVLCKNFGPTKGVVSIFIKGQLSEQNVKKLFENSELFSILDLKLPCARILDLQRVLCQFS